MRKFAPKWVILIMDLFVVAGSFIFLWVIRAELHHNQGNYFLEKLIIILSIYFLGAFIFKTHTGIIRFSTTIDLKNLLLQGIFFVAVYRFGSVIINAYLKISPEYSDRSIYPLLKFWVPIVLGVIIFLNLVFIRFSIRTIFHYLEKNFYSSEKKESIYILGTEFESVMLMNAILNDATNQYKPIGFISFSKTTKENNNNSFAGYPTISGFGNFIGKLNKIGVKKVILYKNQVKHIPIPFIDECIDNNIEILIVNTFLKYGEENGNGDGIKPRIDKIKIEDLLDRHVIEVDKDLISRELSDKTILVTGAAGSIGSEIVRQLAKFNVNKVLMVDFAESPLNDLWIEIGRLNLIADFIPIIANVTIPTRTRQIFETYKPDIIFHASAYKHVPMMELFPPAAANNNIGSTFLLANLAVEFGAEKFVMISTDKAVNPTNVMGATKRASEIYIQSLNEKLFLEAKNINKKSKKRTTQFVTTRFGNVLGSNGSVVPLFKRQIEEGGPITLTHKEITRFFMTISEACSLVLEAGSFGEGGEIFMFDMGEAVKIYSLAEKMIRLAGKVPHKEIEILEVGLRPGEKLYEELLLSKEQTIPTINKKIVKALVPLYDYNEVSKAISEILHDAQSFNREDVVYKLKKLIPEFKSQNSEFETLDQLNK